MSFALWMEENARDPLDAFVKSIAGKNMTKEQAFRAIPPTLTKTAGYQPVAGGAAALPGFSAKIDQLNQDALNTMAARGVPFVQALKSLPFRLDSSGLGGLAVPGPYQQQAVSYQQQRYRPSRPESPPISMPPRWATAGQQNKQSYDDMLDKADDDRLLRAGYGTLDKSYRFIGSNGRRWVNRKKDVTL